MWLNAWFRQGTEDKEENERFAGPLLFSGTKKYVPFIQPKHLNMKKLVIGALVGGLLVFIWQTLSWTILMRHAAEYQKAPGQDAILQALNGNLTAEGQYILPGLDASASMAEHEKAMDDMKGKPWAVVAYHKSYDTNMGANIIRNLLVDLIAVFLVCWVLLKNTTSTFGTTFFSTLCFGLVGYLFIPYSMVIWYKTPGGVSNLIDSIIAWGLCGLWLGWWLNRRK